MTTLPLIHLFTCVWLLNWLLSPLSIHAEFVGHVVGVIDGDSIRVMHDGQVEQIRLVGVDCPEKRQPFGTRAKEYMEPSETAMAGDSQKSSCQMVAA